MQYIQTDTQTDRHTDRQTETHSPGDGSDSGVKVVLCRHGACPWTKQLVHRVKETREGARDIRLLKRRERFQQSSFIGGTGEDGERY